MTSQQNMPVLPHGFHQGRPYYQGQGKKHFYNLGDARGRQAARLKAEAMTGAGAKFKITPYVGADGRGAATGMPATWGMIPYKKMHGGASWRFNTQTPEKVEELKKKYAGKAHPDFVEQYADVLADRPRMYGWRSAVPSSEWRPEEHAAYLRDGSPKSKADFARIMGTVGNERQY